VELEIVSIAGRCKTGSMCRLPSGPNLAWDSGPMVYVYRLSFIWIGVLCHWCKAKPPKCRNVDQIFAIWGVGSCAYPLHRSWPNLVENSRPTVYAYVPNFIFIGLFYCPLAVKNPKLCRIFGHSILWCH